LAETLTSDERLRLAALLQAAVANRSLTSEHAQTLREIGKRLPRARLFSAQVQRTEVNEFGFETDQVWTVEDGSIRCGAWRVARRALFGRAIAFRHWTSAEESGAYLLKPVGGAWRLHQSSVSHG
jgi:hypothetical protein